jgi:putative alpha-1,2-mannosidase
MFPGVARPFGVVKLGPDLYTGVDAYSGYLPTGNVTGYSLMHESGTGGAPKYGVVSQMPVIGNVSNPLADLSLPRANVDTAVVGYYKSTLTSQVVTELAATDHAGILQYTFPPGRGANVVVDVSHVLPSFRGLGLGQNYTGGSITIYSDGHYEGSGTYNNGWNLGKYRFFFFFSSNKHNYHVTNMISS